MADGILSGKTAIVTGAGSGIGRAAALRLAESGARIVAADLADDGGMETLELIRRSGREGIFVRTDVADFDSCRRLVEEAASAYGSLDIAFNNAGVVESPPGKTAKLTRASWDRVIAVNLTGVFNCLHHELGAMVGRGGAIVNTSSIMGLKGTPGGAAYCASKHGVIGLTRACALEYGEHGIRVNVICPGYVATPLTVGGKSPFSPAQVEKMRSAPALGRLAEPREVADLVVWLCSDQASYVTGAVMSVDGGVGTA